MMYEQRRFTRVEMEKLCSVTTSEGQVIPAEIEDASFNGLSLAVGEALQLGAKCTIVVIPEPDKEIEIRGTVIFRKDGHCSVDINGVRAGGLEHWRELIVGHAEDPAEMDNEITSRMDIWPDTY